MHGRLRVILETRGRQGENPGIATKRGTGARLAAALLPGLIVVSLLSMLGGIIAIGQQRGLYDWSVAYLLFIGATAVSAGFTAWRLGSHFRETEHERERYFTMGVDLHAVADFRGRFIRVNPAFADVLGWSSKELVSRPFLEFVHSEDRDATVAEFEKLCNGAPVLRFYNRYKCKDGAWRVLSWRAVSSAERGRIYASARDVTRLREAEQKLRESEENLSVTLRSIGDGVLTTDSAGRVTRLNAAAERLTGWTETEALGRPAGDVFRIVNQHTREPVAVPVDAVLRTGEIQSLITPTVLIARDGSECPIGDSAAPIRDDGGELLGAVLAFRDASAERLVEVTMRRANKDLDRRVRQRTAELEKANAQLEQSRESLALAQRVARMGSWDLDLLTERGWWSDEMYELTGRDPAQGPPPLHGFLELVHPEDRPGLMEAYSLANERGETRTLEARSNPEHGPIRHFVGVVGPVLSGTGRVTKIMGTLQDVTKQKEAELALAQTRERLELTVRAGNVGVWDWNIGTGDVYFSAEYKRQLGYAEYEFDGRYDEWSDLLHPEDKARAIAAVHAYVANPKGRYSQEFRLKHKDGGYRWIHAQGSLVPAREGGPRLLGTHIDITEHKRLEAQFFEAQKMESVGRLAGGVAHDFNNLLSVINGYSDLALQRLPEDSSIRDDIGEVRKAGDRAAALTRQLLAFSRRQVLQPVVVDLSAHLIELKKMLGRVIGEDVELTVDSVPDLGRVKIDPGQFEQMVINLAVNACDAMPHGGALTIELRNASRDEIPGAANEVCEHYVCLTVTDSGVGMDAATLEQIYEPFFTTKHEGRGTGLGLATVFGIVKQSNGYIHASSEGGRGSSFQIFLPTVQAEAPRPARARPARASTGTETVLVVEDDENLRRLTERVLRSAGYTVLSAAGANEAIKLVSDEGGKPQLLLTDVVMPGLSGPELARRLKRIQPDLKVLFMSGYAGDALAQYDLVADESHFIGKPFDAAKLAGKVREILNTMDVATPSGS